ncbi:MAG TPA: glycosyltransferase [Anaerolineae bacterium]|nr:glycosyltransferase [Anaerolineae bacterium]
MTLNNYSTLSAFRSQATNSQLSIHTQPLISCIMPTYNRRTFVPKAIEYFLRQDYQNRELIILDDGTDPIEDLVPEDPRIRYLHQNNKLSLGMKRNIACNNAQGKIIVHWDDDDWIAPWRLKYQVENLLKEQGDICGLDKLFFYSPYKKQLWQYVYSKGSRVWVAGGSLCYTKEFWKKNKFPDINVGEDTRFVWGHVQKKIVTLKDNTFYLALIHPGNASAKRTTNTCWYPVPNTKVTDIIGDDYFFYDNLVKGKENVKNVRTSDSKIREDQESTHKPECNEPQVTVSIPYYQCKQYIGRAVESILNQTYKDLILIVVNDGDENPPWDELEHINDPRLIRFELSSNRGRYFADAVVLEATSSPYFLIQDADDWSDPTRIEVLMKKMNEDDSIGAISSSYLMRSVNGRIQRNQKILYPRLEKPLTRRFEFRSDHHGLFFSEALKKIGGYYAGFRIGYDTLIVNMLLMIGQISYVEQPLYNRIIRSNSLTTSSRTGMRSTQRLEVRAQLEKMYEDIFTFYEQYHNQQIDHETLVGLIRKNIQSQLSSDVNQEIMYNKNRLRTLLNNKNVPRQSRQSRSHAYDIVTTKTNRIIQSEREESVVDQMINDTRLKWTEWTITPAVAFELSKRLCELKPANVLEIGSGLSTILLAKLASLYGICVVTLEHERNYYQKTRNLLREFDLHNFIDLRLAPLTQMAIPGEKSSLWYNAQLREKFDFVFIDGPPKKYGRTPSLFALYEFLKEETEVWLHDGHRQHEKKCIEIWDKYFTFSRSLYPDDKGVWIMKEIMKQNGWKTYN